jgi:hypothetical protein
MTDNYPQWEREQAAGEYRADRVADILADFRADPDIGAVMRAMESMTDRWNAACGEVGFGRFKARPFTPVEIAMEALLDALGAVDLEELADRKADD